MCTAFGLVGLMVLAVQARSACEKRIVGPLATVNARGEMLVAWQDTENSGYELCGSAVADAAIGSTESGFTNMGTVSVAGTLSYPTSMALDGAGNGWIVGVHQVAESGKYGPTYKNVGAWFAYRPAGGSFQSPVELPTGGIKTQSSAFVAGNQAGRTVLAWSTERGTYLAWGTPTGSISAPTFIGRGFQVSGLSVDESGRALVVGCYYSEGLAVRPIEIAAVSSDASGSFSRPHVLAVRRQNRRKHLIGFPGLPVVGIGPNGNAIVAWEIDWLKQHTAYEYAGLSQSIYRQADGHFDKPVRLPKGFVQRVKATTVDTAGRAIIVLSARRGLREATVTPGGHVGSERHLEGSLNPSVADNALGQVVIVWEEGGSSIGVVLGNTQGINGARQILAIPHNQVLATMDARGIATVLWVAEESPRETTLNARAITPGAQTVKVASGEPAVP